MRCRQQTERTVAVGCGVRAHASSGGDKRRNRLLVVKGNLCCVVFFVSFPAAEFPSERREQGAFLQRVPGSQIRCVKKQAVKKSLLRAEMMKIKMLARHKLQVCVCGVCFLVVEMGMSVDRVVVSKRAKLCCEIPLLSRERPA